MGGGISAISRTTGFLDEILRLYHCGRWVDFDVVGGVVGGSTAPASPRILFSYLGAGNVRRFPIVRGDVVCPVSSQLVAAVRIRLFYFS